MTINVRDKDSVAILDLAGILEFINRHLTYSQEI